MAGYVVAQVNIEDPEQYGEYKKLVAATVEAHGGKFLVRGGDTEVLEGAWSDGRFVIIEFDNVDQAKEWWSSEAYESAKTIRQKAAKTNMLVAAGI